MPLDIARSGRPLKVPRAERYSRWKASSTPSSQVVRIFSTRSGAPGMRTVEGICPGARCRWYCAPASLVGASARRSPLDIVAAPPSVGWYADAITRCRLSGIERIDRAEAAARLPEFPRLLATAELAGIAGLRGRTQGSAWGAAVLAGSGLAYPGANVEAASYGGTICAERSALVGAVVAGEKEIGPAS